MILSIEIVGRYLSFCNSVFKDITVCQSGSSASATSSGSASNSTLASAGVSADQSFLRQTKDVISVINSILEHIEDIYRHETTATTATAASEHDAKRVTFDLVDVPLEQGTGNIRSNGRLTFLSTAISLVLAMQAYVWNQQRSSNWKDVDPSYHDAYSCCCLATSVLKLAHFDLSSSSSRSSSSSSSSSNSCNSNNNDKKGNMYSAGDTTTTSLTSSSSSSSPSSSNDADDDFNPVYRVISSIIKDCDYGILMGSPSISGILNELINLLCTNEDYASYRKRKLETAGSCMKSSSKRNCLEVRPFVSQLFTRKTATSLESSSPPSLFSGVNPSPNPSSQPKLTRMCAGRSIRRVDAPDLLTFFNNFFVPMEPVIITGLMTDWPALSDPTRTWSNLDYLNQCCGDRVVPVELGSHYLADDSSQCLILLRQFISQYLCKSSSASSSTAAASSSTAIASSSINQHVASSINEEGFNLDTTKDLGETTGYLAQHKLFDQIPKLRYDIATPDYCALVHPVDDDEMIEGASSRSFSSSSNSNSGSGGGIDDVNGNRSGRNDFDDVHINAWLGPDNSVSPLHHDPYFNLLAQVVGNKYVRLYSCSESSKLYPMTGRSSNNSQVDLTKPIEETSSLYPDSCEAEYSDGVLGPGDMLFIPRWHWHFITALNVKEVGLYYQNQQTIDVSSSKSSSDFDPTSSYHSSLKKDQDSSSEDSPSFSFSVNFWWGKRVEKQIERDNSIIN